MLYSGVLDVPFRNKYGGEKNAELTGNGVCIITGSIVVICWVGSNFTFSSFTSCQFVPVKPQNEIIFVQEIINL